MDQYYNPNMQYYGNPNFMYNPQMYNGYAKMPVQQNALTAEEIQKIQYKRPTQGINLEVDELDVLRAICTHKDNGTDRVSMLNDGTDRMYCPICGATWDSKNYTKEDAEHLVSELIDMMQSAKWIADFPTEIVRNYFAIIPMLKKFPELYEFASKNFDRFYTQRGFMNAPDANIHAQYNGLFSANAMMGGGYQMPVGYYNQAPQQMAAMPTVNPMQMGQVNPMVPGFNPQFANQANVMMGGTYYPQQQVPPAWAPQPNGQVIIPPQPQANPYAVPTQPQQNNAAPGYSPVYGAQPQQTPPAAPAANPQPATNTSNPQTVTIEPKIDL